jgi:RNA recognition motif-containing protein
MKIYVGNLSRDVSQDMFSGESKGFGFVEMQVAAEAQAAMTALNGKEIKGRVVTVNEARPRPEGGRGGGRPGGGGGGRPGGGGRGGFGGGGGGKRRPY